MTSHGEILYVFAKKTDQPAVYRQLWQSHRMKEDQGLVLAANDRPVAPGRSLKDIIGDELENLLQSKSEEDIKYAIRQFDEMKENRRCSTLFHLLVPGGK
jgi:hypothetical protein